MVKEFFEHNNITKGGLAVPFLPFRTKQKASLLNCRLAFVVHRESLSILPNLIASRLKQRRKIQPIELINSFYALFHYQQHKPAYNSLELIKGMYRGIV